MNEAALAAFEAHDFLAQRLFAPSSLRRRRDNQPARRYPEQHSTVWVWIGGMQSGRPDRRESGRSLVAKIGSTILAVVAISMVGSG